MINLYTKRLVLRKPRIQDADSIFNLYAQDKEVVKYLTWKPHTSIEDTKDFLYSVIERIKQKGDFVYVIEKLETKELIGMIDIQTEDGSAVCGYVLARKYWGNGFMTEALNKVLENAFTNTIIKSIEAFCDVENKASARVLEKVCMKLIKRVKDYVSHPNVSDEPRDCFLYRIHKYNYSQG